jgi:hypothetical protein
MPLAFHHLLLADEDIAFALPVCLATHANAGVRDCNSVNVPV